MKGGDGCALSYAVGKAIAIVPNEKIYEFVFLVLLAHPTNPVERGACANPKLLPNET